MRHDVVKRPSLLIAGLGGMGCVVIGLLSGIGYARYLAPTDPCAQLVASVAQPIATSVVDRVKHTRELELQIMQSASAAQACAAQLTKANKDLKRLQQQGEAHAQQMRVEIETAPQVLYTLDATDEEFRAWASQSLPSALQLHPSENSLCSNALSRADSGCPDRAAAGADRLPNATEQR